jgi:hypothetical protein
MNFISRIILFLVLIPALYGAGERDFVVQFEKYSDYNSATEEHLRDLYNQQQGFFRLPGSQYGRKCRVILTKAAPPGEILVTPQNGGWQIEFDHTAGEWRQDRRFIARLLGIFFVARHTAEPPPERDFMPRWIVSGILHRIESKRGSAQLMKRNQDFAVSRAIFADDGNLPDFKELTKLPADLLEQPGIIRVWTDEFSRLLLEHCLKITSPKHNPLLQYTKASLKGMNEELAFEQYFSPHFLREAMRTPRLVDNFGLGAWNRMPPPVKVQRYLEHQTFRMVFNNFHPQPVRELHKQFTAWSKINLPVPEAKPGTPPETFDMANYPALLDDHPHAPETLPRKLRELRSVAADGDLEFKEAVQQLGMILHEMQKNPSSPSWSAARRYRKQFPLIPETLVRRQMIEKVLKETDEAYRSPARFYEEAIRESLCRQPGETPRITELLDKAEKAY